MTGSRWLLPQVTECQQVLVAGIRETLLRLAVGRRGCDHSGQLVDRGLYPAMQADSVRAIVGQICGGDKHQAVDRIGVCLS